MKLFTALLIAGAVAGLGHKASAVVYSTNAVGLLSVQVLLHEDNAPANGFFDIWTEIYNAPSGGNVVARDTNTMVSVSNGLANLLFENLRDLAFNTPPTEDLYLELALRRTGETGPFTVLSPRQRIVPSLFATSAVRAEEAKRLIEPLSVDLLPSTVARLDSSSTFTGTVTFAPVSGPPFAVNSSAVVAGLDADLLDGYDSSEFWKLEGNGGTVAGMNFLGTTDDEPLELKVNNRRALRLEPSASGPPNLIGGGEGNSVNSGVYGATVGGGGSTGLFPANANTIYANYSTIAGGRANEVQPGATEATIGGGLSHVVRVEAEHATISGGESNVVADANGTIGGGSQNTVSAWSGTIGGGFRNEVATDAFEGVIGGGFDNQIDEGSWLGTIGGGTKNAIEHDTRYATIGGGATNVVVAGSSHAAIGGGSGNKVQKSFGTVPGGRDARTLSHGQMAYASGQFSTVGDAQSSLFVLRGVSSAANSSAWTELFLDGVSERMHVTTTGWGAWTFDILVVGQNTGGSVGFHITGLVQVQGGVISLPVPPTVTQFNQSSVLVNARMGINSADTSLRIETRWQLAESDTKWVASVRTAEVILPGN